MGCAEDDKAFIEIKFEDGKVLKKQNIEFEYCESMEIDITEDIKIFQQGIMEMNISFSKRSQRFVIDHKLFQNQINLKLDCITN